MNKAKAYCLAIDQGTLSSRAVLFDKKGVAVFSARKKIRLQRLPQGYIEQDADELLDSVREVIQQTLTNSGVMHEQIQTAGLTTQRSSIVAWSKSTGQPLSAVISWQDTRAGSWLNDFTEHTRYVRSVTGLQPNPHYGVSKLHWLIANNKKVAKALDQNDCVITPLASFILFHITGNDDINIDIANASRMMLCNLFDENWDESLLRLFRVRPEWLANCRPVIYDYGTLKNTGIRIKAVNGDQPAARYSDGPPETNVMKVNLGTGAFVLCAVERDDIRTKEFTDSGLLAGISCNGNGHKDYYIEGTVNGAGAAIEWLQEKLQLEEIRSMLPQHKHTNTAAGIFINSIGGIGSPVWRSDIPCGFVDEKNEALVMVPQQALVAVIESIVFLLMLNIQNMLRLKKNIHHIEISGGLSNNDYICQCLANLSRLKVNRQEDSEATARGIGWLSLQDRSQWKRARVDKEFDVGKDEFLTRRFNQFKQHLKHKYGVNLA